MIENVLSVQDATPIGFKSLRFEPGKITLPNKLAITYAGIKKHIDDKGRVKYTYFNGKTDKNLYFGIVAENVVSATARCIIADGMDRIQSRYRCAMPVHDEGVWVVPEHEVDEAVPWIKKQLTTECSYMPGLPLDATVGAARRYGEAKQ
jgi:hypothetical protein